MTTVQPSSEKLGRRRRWYRLYFTTYFLLLLGAAPLVLSNVVEEEDYAWLVSTQPGVVKLSREQLLGQPGKFANEPLMVANEYGWPRSWLWLNANESAADPRVAYGALAINIAVWCAILAAVALVGEFVRRRYWPRWQWSLRTMLIGVGICCALSAWSAARYRAANRQDEIVAQIQAVGGGVHFERWGPNWLKQFGADRYRRTVVRVALGGVKQRVDIRPILKLMPSLPSLRRLDFDRVALTDGEVDSLAQLTRLEELFLNGAVIDDSRLDFLRTLTNLRLLHLGHSQISDAGLAHLKSLTKLESLYLSETAIEGDGFDHLSQLPQLKLLDLVRCKVRSLGPRPITGFQNLEELYLHGTLVDDEAIISLARLPGLRRLDLTNCRVSDRAVEALSQSSSLKELGLDSHRISGRALLGLKNLELKALHFGGNASPSLLDGEMHPTDVESLMTSDGYMIIVSRHQRDAIAQAFDQLRAACPSLAISGSRLTPADRRERGDTRAIDFGEGRGGFSRRGMGYF